MLCRYSSVSQARRAIYNIVDMTMLKLRLGLCNSDIAFLTAKNRDIFPLFLLKIRHFHSQPLTGQTFYIFDR